MLREAHDIGESLQKKLHHSIVDTRESKILEDEFREIIGQQNDDIKDMKNYKLLENEFKEIIYRHRDRGELEEEVKFRSMLHEEIKIQNLGIF